MPAQPSPPLLSPSSTTEAGQQPPAFAGTATATAANTANGAAQNSGRPPTLDLRKSDDSIANRVLSSLRPSPTASPAAPSTPTPTPSSSIGAGGAAGGGGGQAGLTTAAKSASVSSAAGVAPASKSSSGSSSPKPALLMTTPGPATPTSKAAKTAAASTPASTSTTPAATTTAAASASSSSSSSSSRKKSLLPAVVRELLSVSLLVEATVSLVGLFLLTWLGLTNLGFLWLLGAIAWLSLADSKRRQKLFLLAEERAHREVRRERAVQDSETTEWLNTVIERYWVFYEPILCKTIKDSIEPVLASAKPGLIESIKLTTFTLGSMAPYIRTVRVLAARQIAAQKASSSEEEEVAATEEGATGLVTSISSAANILMMAKKRASKRGSASAAADDPYARPSPGYQQRLSTSDRIIADVELGFQAPLAKIVVSIKLGGKFIGLTLPVQLKEIDFAGTMRTNVKLIDQFPHLDSITFGFLNMPRVRFAIQPLKTIDIMDVPKLSEWLYGMVEDALRTSVVDPHNITINLNSNKANALMFFSDIYKLSTALYVVRVSRITNSTPPPLTPSGTKQASSVAVIDRSTEEGVGGGGSVPAGGPPKLVRQFTLDTITPTKANAPVAIQPGAAMPDSSAEGTLDLYCTVKIGDDKRRTEVLRVACARTPQGVSPTNVASNNFDTPFVFLTSQPEFDTMTLTVRRKRKLKNETLGCKELALYSLDDATGKHNVEVELETIDGLVHLEIQRIPLAYIRMPSDFELAHARATEDAAAQAAAAAANTEIELDELEPEAAKPTVDAVAPDSAAPADSTTTAALTDVSALEKTLLEPQPDSREFGHPAMPAYAPANIDSGIFTLIVHAARNLDAADSDGLSDPFCIVDIRTRTRKYEWFSTNYKRDTLNPEWEVAKEVAVLDFRTTKVRINLFDFDDLSDNDPLGHCLINLQTMFAVDLIRERVWIPVLFDKDTAKLKEGLKRPYHGEVCVSGIFRPQPLVFDDAPPDTSDDVDTEVTGVTSALGKGARLSGKGAKALLTTSRDIMTLKRLRNIGKKHHKVDSATITVRLIEGENLPAMDSTGLSDPYVVGRLGSKQLFQSRVIKTTLNPKWNDTFKAHVSDRYAHPLTLNVRDMNAIGSHSMGEIEISLTDEQSCQGEPKWYPVTGKSHSRGRVLVAVTLVLADSIGQEEELDEDDEDEEAVFDPPSDESSEVLAAATRDRTLTASSQDLDWEGEESMTAHARGSLKRLGKPFKAAAMTIAAMSRGMHHHSDASSASTSTPTTPRQTGAVASIANSASTSSPTTPRQPGANPAAANNASSTAAADAVNAAANAATAMAVTATGATVASATGDPDRAGMTNATLFVPGGPVARGPSAESERSGTGIAASPSRHSLAALGAGEMRVARLSAVIIQAKDLSLPDSKGPGSHVPPEAYVKVRAGRSVVYKTSKHKLLSNATVRWDEAFSFASINLALKPVVFQIKEKKALLNSGLIGAHDLSLEAVFPGWQQWLSAQASNAAASPSELKKTIWLQLSPVGRGSLQVSLTLSSVQA